MKIAVIGARGIPAQHGEIERYCQELYPQIAYRGHQVDLFAQPHYHHQPCFSSYYYQKVKVIILLGIPIKIINYWLNSALNTIWATFGNYDVIHIHGLAAACFSWVPRWLSRTKVVVTFHQAANYSTHGSRLWRYFLPWVEKIVVRNADEIIVTSRALTKYFFRKYAIATRYIANAPGKYSRTRSRVSCGQVFGVHQYPYILFLGKFDPTKRVDLLIKAFRIVSAQGWKLVLAGEIGKSLKHFTELLNLAEYENNIIFAGEVRGNCLIELLQGAAIFVDPADQSDLELSMTLLEAMGEGIPVLASDTQVHQGLLSGDRGLLFKSGELNSLVKQLQYAMSNPHLLELMTKKAQQYIAVHHNWDRVTYCNLFLYLQLTAAATDAKTCHYHQDQ